MDLATIRPAIRAAVRDCTRTAFEDDTTGLPDYDVYWLGQRDATGWHGSVKGAEVKLRVLALGSSGIDEVRKTFVPAAGLVPAHRTVRRVGNRRLVIQIQVESSVNTDAADALAISSRIRTNLRRPEIAAALYAVGVSLATIHTSVDLSRVAQDVCYSVWVTDVILLAAEVVQDPDQTTGWVDSAAGTLTTQTPTGETEF
jgi:hypothetical protein